MVNFNRLWRLFATGFCFTTFGIGGAIISQLGFPIVRLIYPDPNIHHRKIKKIISQSFHAFILLMKHTGLGTFETFGEEKAKTDAGCLIIANHPSLIDVVYLISKYPRANCFVKDSLFKNPFLKHVVEGAGYINSSLGEAALEKAKDHLDDGEVLVIFPEGTRSVPGKPLNMKRGAAHAALYKNIPIRLVKISMTPPTLCKGEKWYQIPMKKPYMKMEFLEKIQPSEFPSNDLPPSIRARRLTEHFKNRLES